MRVVDLVQQLIPIAQQNPQLQVVVRGQDDRGNEMDIKLLGTVGLSQDEWGTYILLK